MQIIANLIAIVFRMLFRKFVGLAAWIGGLAVAAFGSFWIFGQDLFAWGFEQILKLLIVCLNTINITFSAFDFTQYMSGIPDNIRSTIALIGLDTATSILVGAVVVRFGLMLIPFVNRLFK